MKKVYHGSCHCKAIQFEADVDLNQGTGKCNCSICTKSRNWNVTIKPEDFRMHAEQGALGDYTFATQAVHHHFCKICGIRVFSQGYIEAVGGAFVAVQVTALDDLSPKELLQAPVQYSNGRDNDWWQQPEEVRHL